jgi:hypothetical protein
MSSTNRKFTEMGLQWNIVEEAINREIEWLERVIEQTVIGKVPGCDDCRYTYRKIALLIVTGKIKAKEFIAREGSLFECFLVRRDNIFSLWIVSTYSVYLLLPASSILI